MKIFALIITLMLVIGTFAFIPALTMGDTTASQSFWARINGVINQWGPDPTFGWLSAYVRMIDMNGTTREMARVQAVWSNNVSRMNCVKPPTENFTFSFYNARLINTTDVKLNYSGYNLYIAGIWNVSKITVSIFVNENGTFLYKERIIENYLPDPTEGNFTIYNHWSRFEVTIAGMPVLSGFIVIYRLAYVEIKLFDWNNDGKVDIRDLVKVARRYRMTPGLFNYDNDADVNMDGHVDMADLTTVAANIGS